MIFVGRAYWVTPPNQGVATWRSTRMQAAQGPSMISHGIPCPMFISSFYPLSIRLLTFYVCLTLPPRHYHTCYWPICTYSNKEFGKGFQCWDYKGAKAHFPWYDFNFIYHFIFCLWFVYCLPLFTKLVVFLFHIFVILPSLITIYLLFGLITWVWSVTPAFFLLCLSSGIVLLYGDWGKLRISLYQYFFCTYISYSLATRVLGSHQENSWPT